MIIILQIFIKEKRKNYMKLNGKMKKNVKTLKVKTISFRNLKLESIERLKKDIDNEEYLFKHNPAKYRTIYFVNKSHYPHWYHDSREIILNTIKSYLLLKLKIISTNHIINIINGQED
jgi:hypothetical protein